MRLNVEQIRRMYVDEAMTQKQIADAIGSSEGSIQNLISRHKIKRATSQSDRLNSWKTPECIQSVRDMYERGMTKVRIAKELGFKSVTPINKIFVENGIASKGNSGRWKSVDLDSLNIAGMYSYMSAVEIANTVGVSPSSIDQHLKRHGIETTLKGGSLPEKIIKEFLDDAGVSYTYRDRKTLNGLELDFMIHDKKIAIEVNGCYWHSEQKVGKAYHINKTNACEAQQIQLLHFWDEEIINKTEIVLSMILSKIGRCSKIGARQCNVKVCNTKEAREFFTKSHLQGFAPAKTYVALTHNDEIMCMASFSTPRYDKRHDIELIRFASKLNHNVVGGLSRLMKHVAAGQSVISYANRRWSTGNAYLAAGWNLDRIVSPGYYYYINNKGIFHRSNFQKKNLVSSTHYSDDLTEYEIMLKMGHDRIWDCGQIAFSTKV